MKVPLLDLAAQLETIQGDVNDAVLKVVNSCRYILGPEVEEFEKEVADYSGTNHGVGVSSGTDALLVSLMALDIGPDDVVLTTPYSFFSTAGCIARVGAKPEFVDIDETTFNICPKKLDEYFSVDPKKVEKVKAIIIVQLYGQLTHMQELMDVANKYDIPVIEDAAQSIGARCTYNGKEVRAGSMGAFGCFSFFPSKNLGGVGDGGMVVANDDALFDKVKMLRNHGAKPKYFHKLVGGNFRLDPIQAAVLRVKLKHLDEWSKGRQDNASYYDNAFSNSSIITPPIHEKRDYHIYNQYVIRVPERRDELRSFLKENDIGNEVYYPRPFHLQECFSYLGYKEGDFPISENAATHSLALPVYPELTNEMQDYVVSKIKEFYGL